jgi:hypothetical protein
MGKLNDYYGFVAALHFNRLGIVTVIGVLECLQVSECFKLNIFELLGNSFFEFHDSYKFIKRIKDLFFIGCFSTFPLYSDKFVFFRVSFLLIILFIKHRLTHSYREGEGEAYWLA